jgi:hypothetical protein
MMNESIGQTYLRHKHFFNIAPFTNGVINFQGGYNDDDLVIDEDLEFELSTTPLIVSGKVTLVAGTKEVTLKPHEVKDTAVNSPAKCNLVCRLIATPL